MLRPSQATPVGTLGSTSLGWVYSSGLRAGIVGGQIPASLVPDRSFRPARELASPKRTAHRLPRRPRGLFPGRRQKAVSCAGAKTAQCSEYRSGGWFAVWAVDGKRGKRPFGVVGTEVRRIHSRRESVQDSLVDGRCLWFHLVAKGHTTLVGHDHHSPSQGCVLAQHRADSREQHDLVGSVRRPATEATANGPVSVQNQQPRGLGALPDPGRRGQQDMARFLLVHGRRRAVDRVVARAMIPCVEDTMRRR